jgi:hypothetical protein
MVRLVGNFYFEHTNVGAIVLANFHSILNDEFHSTSGRNEEL